MKYYKCKYLKKSKPQGREYYFRSVHDFELGDIVRNENGNHVLVVAVADSDEDREFVERLEAYKIKSLVERVEV